MQKDFISYYLALELKLLGFDEPCFGYYREDKSLTYTGIISQNTNSFWLASPNKIITAPLFSQAFRFFRNKGVSISLDTHDSNVHQFYIKWKTKDNEPKSILSEYETYEEMELECIKELINIFKKYEL